MYMYGLLTSIVDSWKNDNGCLCHVWQVFVYNSPSQTLWLWYPVMLLCLYRQLIWRSIVSRLVRIAVTVRNSLDNILVGHCLDIGFGCPMCSSTHFTDNKPRIAHEPPSEADAIPRQDPIGASDVASESSPEISNQHTFTLYESTWTPPNNDRESTPPTWS